MCGTVVWNCALHPMRPRLSTSRPARSSAERVGVAGAADAEQHRFAQQPLAAFQFDGDAARLRFANRYDAFAQAEDHAQRAGMVEQRLDDLAVAEFEQLRAAVDDGHLHAERGEHDGVFEADHAAADDDHRTRHAATARGLRRSRRPFRR